MYLSGDGGSCRYCPEDSHLRLKFHTGPDYYASTKGLRIGIFIGGTAVMWHPTLPLDIGYEEGLQST